MHVPIDKHTENGIGDVTNSTASISTTARGNMTKNSNQERKEYFVTGHKAELINKDQPNMKYIIIANAREDVTKEP